jgi:hypothetical protein
MRPIDRLDELPDDGGARGIRQLGELLEMLIGGAPGTRALSRGADEDRALYRRSDCDELFTDGTSSRLSR